MKSSDDIIKSHPRLRHLCDSTRLAVKKSVNEGRIDLLKSLPMGHKKISDFKEAEIKHMPFSEYPNFQKMEFNLEQALFLYKEGYNIRDITIKL